MRKKLELIVATRNRGKIREIREALKGLGIRIYALSDFDGVAEIKEDGKSFTENALKKAWFYSKVFGKLTLADDSGLEVECLKGMPGIYSARYAGERASNRENNYKLLKEMEGIPLSKRGARFKCVMALVSPDGKEAMTEGSCKGKIGMRERGRRGFGYDPLFILPKYGKTMAQLPLKEKNRISHRGKALRRLRKTIRIFIKMVV
ncbi:MAG: non-canonical purine NTP pyrophosphatase, RdgB/HAM1 family [Deltaproteobacteria bacterium RBG_19FT_COMBO_46_12]|nr:MAG: non-canonical purine NTP pyrophosphatase, RdgB/HAM1 family [Deltaproteobacteria bacterium RBG_19FT_COMBO_46_12]OGQ06106.1 MAG: non-canonical purine NTP pyrophosphatase, RdgB/HAM1 family [Deltaproteobacteria bacterium RBG_19FT_COMBO_46_12]